jgi:hypothetical protein
VIPHFCQLLSVFEWKLMEFWMISIQKSDQNLHDLQLHDPASRSETPPEDTMLAVYSAVK